jgi:hypothetical protein
MNVPPSGAQVARIFGAILYNGIAFKQTENLYFYPTCNLPLKM